MSLALLHSIAFFGLDALLVDVEADVKRAEKSSFVIVGLPDSAVRESKDRVLSALKNSEVGSGGFHCTINLAPGDLKKEGALYDLPIALSFLLAQGIVRGTLHKEYLWVGELSLSGQMRPMRGALSAALLARKLGKKGIVLPLANASEAAAVPELEVIGIEELKEAIAFLKNPAAKKPKTYTPPSFEKAAQVAVDFSDVKGQLNAKRAVTIAASGGHNLLFFGPPGTGKTLIARAIPGILPPLTLEESLEITKIHSLSGLLQEGEDLVRTRPFRNPHHTISAIGMVGGGKTPRPGELSLAHGGVLFLDELPEFSRHTLEVLRQPLENGSVMITRASTTASFPTQCLFVAAMNPCPCGYLGHPQKPCRDTPAQVDRYRSKISGPLLDRIDLHVEVPPLPFLEIASAAKEESSSTVRERVLRARKKQQERFKGIKTNSQMNGTDLRLFCTLSPGCLSIMQMATDKMGLSARGYSRILKVARTIADLEERVEIEKEHLMEALSYRSWNS